MWPEIAQAKEENRRELLLIGQAIDNHLKEDEEIDPELFELNQLNFLKISATKIVKLPSSIEKLNNLTNLVLQGNQLESLPSEIGNLAKLKLLDASQNQLKELPNTLSNLKFLATLNLSDNLISSVDALEGCCQLAHIDLTNNCLEQFPNCVSEELVHLADILLSGNKICEIPLNINILPSLKILDLKENSLKEVPGEITDCVKIKELHLKGNPLSDKRFKKLVENDRTLPKQVLDYIRQHCKKQSGGTGKGKKGKKGKDKEAKSNEMDELCDQLHIMQFEETVPTITMTEPVKEVRPYIVCCILRSIDLSGSKFKQFIAAQTQLHEGVCEKRLAATIATHDLAKLSGDLRYIAMSPRSIYIRPLGYAKEMIGKEYVEKLQKEADNLRKQQKRNNVSGVHKYIHLLDGKEFWPCLVDSQSTVFSMHPITNSDKSKIEPETTGIFAEVTSSTSLQKAKQVMESLILTILQIGATSETTDSGNKVVKIQQGKVLNEDGGVRVLYPSKIDLDLNNPKIQVIQNEKR